MVTAAMNIILSIISPRYQFTQNDIIVQVVLRGRATNLILLS